MKLNNKIMITTFVGRNLERDKIYKFGYKNLDQSEIETLNTLLENLSFLRLDKKFSLCTKKNYKSVLDLYKELKINRSAVKSLKEKNIITQIENCVSFSHGIYFSFRPTDKEIEKVSLTSNVLVEKHKPKDNFLDWGGRNPFDPD